MSPGGRRAAALGVAVVLIGGAVVVRNGISGGGSGPSAAEKPLRLLCASELATACDEIARESSVTIVDEPAGTSATRLSGVADADVHTLDVDGWLTPAPQPTIVDDNRERAGLASIFGAVSDPIARSPLVLLEWKDRGAVLANHCGGSTTWRCWGDAAEPDLWQSIGGDAAWGPVKITHADPTTSGIGLLVLGQEAESFIGRTDLTRDDFDDPAFQDWFGGVEQAASGRVSADEVATMLQIGPSAVDEVAAAEAEVCPKLVGAVRADQLRVVVPKPVASADVVYAPTGRGSRGSELGDIVTGETGQRALAHAGWRVPGQKTTGGECSKAALGKTSRAPDAGALVALLQAGGNG